MKYPHNPRLVKLSIRALRKAKHIITISESTKKDLMQFIGNSEKNISVVYYGLEKEFKVLSHMMKKQSREKFGLSNRAGKKFILITGHQEYKNHRTAVKVFKQLLSKWGESISLIRLGKETNEWKQLVYKYGIAQQVINITPSLSRDEMAQLYNSVDCLLFPSSYEGFGRPPLEAMACGTPVITSNAASLPEIVGDAAFVHSPDDVAELFFSTDLLLSDTKTHEKQVQKGLERIKKFTSERNFKETAKIYQKVLEGKS